MFEDLLSMLSNRVGESRVDLYRACLNRLYDDFHCSGLDEFCTNMVIGADDLYDSQELDVVVTNACIQLYTQQLLGFGVRLNPAMITLDSLKVIHCLTSSIFESEHRDETDLLLAIVNDEDLSAAEVLGEMTQHSYGINATDVVTMIAYVQEDLILRLTQVLSTKYSKETSVDEAIHVPEFIQRRLQVFQGTFGGVFFDYVNSGGAVGVPFEALISVNHEQLAPIREKPTEFTWEIIFFALASTLPNHEIITTVRAVLANNFPLIDDQQVVNAVVAEYLANYGESLQ